MSGGLNLAGGVGARVGKKHGKALLLAAATATTLLLAPTTKAATDTWVGGTSSMWSLGANWSGSTAPASNDALVFNAAGSAGSILNDDLTSTSFNISSMTFGATAPAYNISGNAFTLTGGITNNGAAQIINDAINLVNNQSFYTSTAPGTLTFNGNITGTGVTLYTNGNTSAGVASTTVFTGTVSLASLVAQGGYFQQQPNIFHQSHHHLQQCKPDFERKRRGGAIQSEFYGKHGRSDRRRHYHAGLA